MLFFSCATLLRRPVTASSAKRKELASLKQLFVFNALFNRQVPGSKAKARGSLRFCKFAVTAALASKAGYPLDAGGVKNGLLSERSELQSV